MAEVVPLLERLLAAAEQVGRTDSVIALLVQLALAREQVGDAPGALEALERAVSLAEPAGYVRVFLDEGEPMLALLRRLLRRGASPVRIRLACCGRSAAAASACRAARPSC